MMQNLDQETLGVLGGMGPQASAAFVRTIYSAYRGQLEQQAPVVLLYSNPKVKDRTSAFLSSTDHGSILGELVTGLRSLVTQGASQLVICCITAHYLLPELPRDLRKKTISLIDLIFEELQASQGRCLLACTTGTRRLGLFQQHPCWEAVQHRIAMPTDSEQAKLHDAIYWVKRNHMIEPLVEVLLNICQNHGVNKLIAGCTELHLVSQACAGPNPFNQNIEVIDPLATVANRCIEESCLLRM